MQTLNSFVFTKRANDLHAELKYSPNKRENVKSTKEVNVLTTALALDSTISTLL